LETEFLVETFIGLILSFVNIDNLPFLAGGLLFLGYNNCSHFFILGLSDIKASGVLNITDVLSFHSEELPPVRVGAPDLHISSLS
jgi:hypothetical protein